MSTELMHVETVTGEDPAPQVALIEEPLPIDASEHVALSDDERLQLRCDLEALLFVTSEPLPLQRLAQLTGRPLAEVSESIAELEEHYTDRGLSIRIVGGGYRFATSPRTRSAVEALLLPPKSSLSPAALETLAVVAYSQPITKAEIEAVRGVNVDGVVNSLVEKGFLTEAGRKEALGRPMLFATTQEFLQSFGLPSLADLPPLPAEHIERLQQEAQPESAPLEGTAESGIASPEISVDMSATDDSTEAPAYDATLALAPPAQGDESSQP